MTGSAFSTNILVPGEGFSTSGNIKTFTKKAENGNSIESHFCPECGRSNSYYLGILLEKLPLTNFIGTPIYGHKVDSANNPIGVVILRAGIFDDPELLNKRKPVAEIYTKQRVSWLSPIEGADQYPEGLALP